MRKDSLAPTIIPTACVDHTSGQGRQTEAAKNKTATGCTPSFVVTGSPAENVGAKIAQGYTHRK